jgi:G3E family GTPase
MPPRTSSFPVPLTILTGFLGAGKTTLLNHILHGDHGLRIAVLVNDFGSINIDSQLIVGVEGESISLSNGCICCTIRDDLLQETVKLLKRAQPPEYIIVETSGVSDPAAVASTFLMPELSNFVSVDGILTVTDAEHLLTLKDDMEDLAAAQLEVADMVILNKVDRVTPARLADVKNFILNITPDARILECSYGQVPLELLLGIGKYDPDRLADRAAKDIHVHEAGVPSDHDHDHNHDHHHHDHDHSVLFNTWSWTSAEPLNFAAVREFINTLPTSIYRAKGVLNLVDFPSRRAVLQVVGRRAALMLGEKWAATPPYSQMVFIAAGGTLDPAALQARLDGCIARQPTPEQIISAMEWERGDVAGGS